MINFRKCLFTVVSLFFMATLVLAKDGFRHYGTWSNVEMSESDEPHAAGFSLTLWENENNLFGYLTQYVGPPYDPPIGKVENLEFDNASGDISFTAKMSIGVIHSQKDNQWIPSKDSYSFKGIIKDEGIDGIMEIASGDARKFIEENKIFLKGKVGVDPFWDNKTYEEWKTFYEPIYRNRGPKW